MGSKPDILILDVQFCISAYKRREKQATPKWSNKEEVTNIKKDIIYITDQGLCHLDI